MARLPAPPHGETQTPGGPKVISSSALPLGTQHRAACSASGRIPWDLAHHLPKPCLLLLKLISPKKPELVWWLIWHHYPCSQSEAAGVRRGAPMLRVALLLRKERRSSPLPPPSPLKCGTVSPQRRNRSENASRTEFPPKPRRGNSLGDRTAPRLAPRLLPHPPACSSRFARIGLNRQAGQAARAERDAGRGVEEGRGRGKTRRKNPGWPGKKQEHPQEEGDKENKSWTAGDTPKLPKTSWKEKKKDERRMAPLSLTNK